MRQKIKNEMLGWYYKIWVDAITITKAKSAEKSSWKTYTLIPMSALMGINLLTFFLGMKTLVNPNLPLFFPVTIFDYRLINDFISIMATLFIPFVILNFLLIFNNNRYLQLMQNYKPHSGKLYKRYAFISIGLITIPFIIGKMFF